MKTIVAKATSLSSAGVQAVKEEIEFLSGNGTAGIVSHSNLEHEITVTISESLEETIREIFRTKGWVISNP